MGKIVRSHVATAPTVLSVIKLTEFVLQDVQMVMKDRNVHLVMYM